MSSTANMTLRYPSVFGGAGSGSAPITSGEPNFVSSSLPRSFLDDHDDVVHPLDRRVTEPIGRDGPDASRERLHSGGGGELGGDDDRITC
jgi:hypothetical protein